MDAWYRRQWLLRAFKAFYQEPCSRFALVAVLAAVMVAVVDLWAS